MLLFRLEENIESWCEQERLPKGEILTLAQVWALSQSWYSDRLSPGFSGRSIEQAEAVFQTLGLTNSFWRFQ